MPHSDESLRSAIEQAVLDGTKGIDLVKSRDNGNQRRSRTHCSDTKALSGTVPIARILDREEQSGQVAEIRHLAKQA